jgi:hypothetical protein
MNSRRFMPTPQSQQNSILSAQTITLKGDKTDIKTIAAVQTQCPPWVIRDRFPMSLWLSKMAALPPKATIRHFLQFVAMGQKRTRAVQQKGSLFDHLVGLGEQIVRDDEAELLYGFEVDWKVEFGRCLY